MNHEITALPVLVIHAHSRCNCRCGMCDIWRTTEGQDFSLAQLQAQMGDIERLGVRWVVFSGGEPLMHADIFPLARALRGLGIKVTLLSTGLLLARFAREIADCVDEVIVSLDGPESVHDRIRGTPGCFHAIGQGIGAIRKYKSDFHFAARCTVQRANHDTLISTARAARALQLNSLSFLAADVSSSAFGRELVWPGERQQAIQLTRMEVRTLSEQVGALIADADGFVIDSPKHLRRIVAHFRALLGLEEFAAPRCNAPWTSAVIETDGRIRPCFFHPALGSVNDQGLERALNSEAARRFRESLRVEDNPVCRRCVCSLYLKSENIDAGDAQHPHNQPERDAGHHDVANPLP
jgi:MoaA/NifB/PqqE/SkfB family radical SAM enzyme